MAAASDSYSRLVAWLKIILPMIALAILSTMFLVSRTIDPSQTIPYADVDVEGLAREERIGAPSYAGMTRDGAAVSFRSESARPEQGQDGRVTAVKPVARIELPSGRSFALAADTGYVDRVTQIAALDGTVELETSDGYRMTTSRAEMRLDATAMQTDGEVHGTGPVGEFTAGRAMLLREPSGSYVLRFENGVNLVYRPGG
jgi:lipopolysaccharide export system protein LptC